MVRWCHVRHAPSLERVLVALDRRASQHLARELHTLPLLHAVGLGWEPEEGAAVVLHRGKRGARRFPSEKDGASLLRQLHAVDGLAGAIDDLEQLRVLGLMGWRGGAGWRDRVEQDGMEREEQDGGPGWSRMG